MVFISHSSKNKEEALEWCRRIENAGIKCWISERDLPEDRSSWSDELMKALRKSSKILALLTPEAVITSVSTYENEEELDPRICIGGEVMNELSNASAEGRVIVPVLLKDFVLPDSYVYLLRKYEWIHSYRLEESLVFSLVINRLREGDNSERKVFLETVKENEYKEFATRVLKKYYTDKFFTEVNGIAFPVFSIKGDERIAKHSITDFDSLCDYENSKLTDFDILDHQSYDQYKWYKEYSRIIDGKVKFPNRPGYMLDELKVDSEGKVSGIMVHVGTYAENVYSTHILEYELYRAFCEFKGKNLDDPVVWSELRSKMSIRNHMHLNVGTPADKDFSGKMMDSLCKGYGRESLLSVQMLVLVKSRRTHKHELKIVERSHNVAIAPGIYQFIPAGGFEILNDSDDNVYEDEELISNFSPGGAVFREYLEEGFNAVEFEGRGSGSIQDRLLNDPRIIEIEDMLEKEEATLQFLGSVMDLAGMRQELSFVLVIDDEDYSRHRFIANDECKKGRILENITVENFESKEKIWEKIHGPSAAMWKLFKETKLYQRILREDAGN